MPLRTMFLQVVSAPFCVELTHPNSCKVGELVSLRVKVSRKGCGGAGSTASAGKTERLSIRVGLHEMFLFTGYTNVVIELNGEQECTSSFGLIALDSGYIPLPHVNVQWITSSPAVGNGSTSSNGRNIVDLSNPATPRFIFVKP